MPQVNGTTYEDSGSKVTNYAGSVNATSQSFTFSEEQNGMTFRNKGDSAVTLTVSGTVYRLPPRSTTEVDDESFTSFDAVTASGTQDFEIKAFKLKSGIPSINSMNTQIMDITRRSGVGYNLNQGLFRFRAALAETPTRTVSVVCIGDSITQGYRAGDYNTFPYASVLRSLLQNKYGGTEVGYQYTGDPSVTKTGTWGTSSGVGRGGLYNSTNGATMQFAFTGTSVDILYTKGNNSTLYGVGTVEIDGIAVGNLDCTGTTIAFGSKVTFSGLSSGSHTLKITAPSDGRRIYVEGIIPHTGSTTGITVHRCGVNGSDTNTWNQTDVYNPTFNVLTPDLTIIALGTNDCDNGIAIANYKTYLGKIIQAALTKNSAVCLVPMMWGDVTQRPNYANYPQYVQAMYELADTNNVGLIDIFSAFGNTTAKNNYTTAQSYGMFGVPNTGTGQSGNDYVHPSNKGHRFIANTIYNHLI